MLATELSVLQNKILCAEETALLSEQKTLSTTVVNAMAHLATLTADLRDSGFEVPPARPVCMRVCEHVAT